MCMPRLSSRSATLSAGSVKRGQVWDTIGNGLTETHPDRLKTSASSWLHLHSTFASPSTHTHMLMAEIDSKLTCETIVSF